MSEFNQSSLATDDDDEDEYLQYIEEHRLLRNKIWDELKAGINGVLYEHFQHELNNLSPESYQALGSNLFSCAEKIYYHIDDIIEEE
jgi:hypothetical protein